jgi:hypothetical protein
MKIEMRKHSMTRWCQESELEQFTAAGWKPVADQEQAREEVIRLRPPVKSRATVKAPEEATLTIKGDE